MKNSKLSKRKIRHKRIRAKVVGIGRKPRLFVFRSNRNIYVQLIDDSLGKTILSASDIKKTKTKKTKTETSKEVGKTIASLALEKKIKEVVFDRGGYEYHGRIKAVAEGAREGGLKF